MLKDVFIAQAASRETPLRSRIEATVQAYLASYAAGDVEARLRLFAPDATFEDPVGTPPMQGHAALRAFFDQIGGLATAARLLRLAINGREAAMLFEVTITAPDNDEATLTVIETMEVDDDGRFKRLRAYWDAGAIS